MTTARKTYDASVATAVATGIASQNSNAAKSQLGLLTDGADVRAQNLLAMTYQITIAAAKDTLRATGDKDIV